MNIRKALMQDINIIRSVEFAMMESIGMTKKQVKNMLMLERTGYFIISAFLVMSLGSGITFGVYMLFKQQADYAVFSYPFLPVLLILIIVLVVCICTPLTILRLNEKEWQLDVLFNEDTTTLHEENTQKTLNILRKTILNIVKTYRDRFEMKLNMVDIMRRCLHDNDILLDVLAKSAICV